MSDIEKLGSKRRADQESPPRKTFRPGEVVSLSAQGEVAGGSPLDRGRRIGHTYSTDNREKATSPRRPSVESAGHSLPLQILSENAGNILRGLGNSGDGATEGPPTPSSLSGESGQDTVGRVPLQSTLRYETESTEEENSLLKSWYANKVKNVGMNEISPPEFPPLPDEEGTSTSPTEPLHPPPTPRPRFLELDPKDTSFPPLREADRPVVSFDAPSEKKEGSSLEPLEFSDISNITSVPSREGHRRAQELALSPIANAEFRATTAFLNANPSDAEHKRFMELMHQARAIKNSRKREEVYNAICKYFQPE